MNTDNIKSDQKDNIQTLEKQEVDKTQKNAYILKMESINSNNVYSPKEENTNTLEIESSVSVCNIKFSKYK